MSGLRGLYPICDLDALAAVQLAPEAFVEAVVSVSPKPALLQLRAKGRSREQRRAVARSLRPRLAGVPLVINDDVELAVELGAPYVHVGQGDAQPGTISGVRFGRSTHDFRQLQDALNERPAYVAFGPVFGTVSKKNAEPSVGPQQLEQAHVQCAGVPLCAIGGLRLEHAPWLRRHCELVALIGALVAPDPQEVVARAARWTAALASGDDSGAR